MCHQTEGHSCPAQDAAPHRLFKEICKERLTGCQATAKAPVAVSWMHACIIRATDTVLHVQDADDLYGSAISKLRAVLTSDPSSQAAERACGLALLDRGSLQGTDAGKLQASCQSHAAICLCLPAHDWGRCGLHGACVCLELVL